VRKCMFSTFIYRNQPAVLRRHGVRDIVCYSILLGDVVIVVGEVDLSSDLW